MPPEGEDEALSERPPLLAAKIAPAAGGSYDLRLPADAYCFASGDVAYLVDTRRARRADVAFAQHAAPFLSRLLPCRTPIHIAVDQVGEFCRMALPILRYYTRPYRARRARYRGARAELCYGDRRRRWACDLQNYGCLRRLVGRSL